MLICFVVSDPHLKPVSARARCQLAWFHIKHSHIACWGLLLLLKKKFMKSQLICPENDENMLVGKLTSLFLTFPFCLFFFFAMEGAAMRRNTLIIKVFLWWQKKGEGRFDFISEHVKSNQEEGCSQSTGHAGAGTEACWLAWLAWCMGESGHGEKRTKDTYPKKDLFKKTKKQAMLEQVLRHVGLHGGGEYVVVSLNQTYVARQSIENILV